MACFCNGKSAQSRAGWNPLRQHHRRPRRCRGGGRGANLRDAIKGRGDVLEMRPANIQLSCSSLPNVY
eukprot:6198311-Pleurochrysis_carterae.AAC.1